MMLPVHLSSPSFPPFSITSLLILFPYLTPIYRINVRSQNTVKTALVPEFKVGRISIVQLERMMNSSKNRSYQTKCLQQLMKLYPKLSSNFSSIADVCPFKEEEDTPSHSDLELLDLMKRLNTKSHQGNKERNKKSMLFQKPEFTCCHSEGGEPHIFTVWEQDKSQYMKNTLPAALLKRQNY